LKDRTLIGSAKVKSSVPRGGRGTAGSPCVDSGDVAGGEDEDEVGHGISVVKVVGLDVFETAASHVDVEESEWGAGGADGVEGAPAGDHFVGEVDEERDGGRRDRLGAGRGTDGNTNIRCTAGR